MHFFPLLTARAQCLPVLCCVTQIQLFFCENWPSLPTQTGHGELHPYTLFCFRTVFTAYQKTLGVILGMIEKSNRRCIKETKFVNSSRHNLVTIATKTKLRESRTRAGESYVGEGAQHNAFVQVLQRQKVVNSAEVHKNQLHFGNAIGWTFVTQSPNETHGSTDPWRGPIPIQLTTTLATTAQHCYQNFSTTAASHTSLMYKDKKKTETVSQWQCSTWLEGFVKVDD